MSLKSLALLEEYRTGQEDLVEEFYRPCLRMANTYDRAVGYFRSSVFLLIGPDLLRFARRGGRIRMICSPNLTSDDVEALDKGYESRKKCLEEVIVREVDELLSYRQVVKNTEALATLISLGIMEVRIVFRPDAQGIYHEKLGIFTDSEGHGVTFKGSVNETWNGWHERGNHETFDVFCDWREGRDARQVERNRAYFQRLWEGRIPGLSVEEFPLVAKKKLRTVAKENLDEVDGRKLSDYFAASKTNRRDRKSSDLSVSDKKRQPFPHQENAIESWKKQSKRGILEHATGSGKTFTALTALKEHLADDEVALVLVPDQLLHKQWSSEIADEIPEATVLKAGAGNNNWKKPGRLKTFTQPGPGLGARIVLATMPTARLPEFRNQIWGGRHLMVVADEVHEIGSPKNSKILSIESGPRMGLSATPRRYGDSVGTAKIFDYFGPIVEPPFSLKDAIEAGRLVVYEYFPEPIRLDAEEAEQWREETKEISKEYARSKRDDSGKPVVSTRLKMMLIQRSRIAKKASAKVPYAVKVIKEHYRDGESWLIYCEDQFQLAEVMGQLKGAGYSPSEYHTNMAGNAGASLDWFEKFGGIMVSIKCLDQGVDIPKISNAIILASSQNPRQFIQRRGRVLRTSSGKHKAAIFDAIVVPISIEKEPEQLSLLKSELRRSIQFANMSVNSSSANKLLKIALDLGIDPFDVGILESDGIEESGEGDDGE